MKTNIIAITLMSSLVLPIVARAEGKEDEVPTDEYTEQSIVAPLAKGRRAPYTGLLITPKTAADVITKIDAFDKRLLIELERNTTDLNAKCKFQLDGAETTCKTDKDGLMAKIESQRQRISQLESSVGLTVPVSDPPSRLTWARTGFAGGVVTTAAAIFAFSALSK
jgi:hypothetical protein